MLHIFIDDDKMNIGGAIQGQPVHGSHRDDSSSTPLKHHTHVVAAAETHSHPGTTDDHLDLSGVDVDCGLALVEFIVLYRFHRIRGLSVDDHLGLSGGQCLQAALNGPRDHRSASPARTSSSPAARFLSPDYGRTPPDSSRARPSRARRRAVRDHGGSGGVSKTGSGATIKRSSSATLVIDDGDSRRTASSSSFGSGLHLGSSVTFCNTFGQHPGTASNTTAAEHHELFADYSFRSRRSCSITLAYPSDSILQTADDANGRGGSAAAAAVESGMKLDHAASPVASRREGPSGSGLFSGRLTLAPPVITYDAVTAMPPSPTQRGADGDWSPGCYQMQSSRSHSVLVTPRGSFLAVNQSPIEFRESMLSISYPNFTGERRTFPPRDISSGQSPLLVNSPLYSPVVKAKM